MLVPLHPVLAHYSGLSLDERYNFLIDVVVQFGFAALAVVSFLHVARKNLLYTFKFDSRVEPRVPNLVAMSSPVISLVKRDCMCAILDGSVYDMATALRTREVVRSVGWLAVTPEPVAQLLHFSMWSNRVSIFTMEGATCLVQSEKKPFLAQHFLHAVSY